MAYEIVIAPDAMAHLRGLAARDRALLLDAIEGQLVHDPTEETRNRKGLRRREPPRWELRVGHFRVLYDVVEAEQRVVVLAIGVKSHSRLLVDGGEFPL